MDVDFGWWVASRAMARIRRLARFDLGLGWQDKMVVYLMLFYVYVVGGILLWCTFDNIHSLLLRY
jgi:hypothetical protein